MIRGLCHGVFDVIHYGHILHLRAARSLCDHLTVCLTPDEFVNKGPSRPVFDIERRVIVLSEMRCVDEVIVGQGPEVALNALATVKPDIYFKGDQYQSIDHPGFHRELQFCAANLIEVMFTQEPTYSSTEALRRLKEAANV